MWFRNTLNWCFIYCLDTTNNKVVIGINPQLHYDYIIRCNKMAGNLHVTYGYLSSEVKYMCATISKTKYILC